MPKDLADRFLAAGVTLEGEQRQVTILFVDLAQSTSLLRERGAERMADLLDELLGAVATVVYRYEGTIVDVAGGRIVVADRPGLLDPSLMDD
jgi:class 3 adenylate cyclase